MAACIIGFNKQGHTAMCYIKEAHDAAKKALRYRSKGYTELANNYWDLAKDYIKLHYGLPV